MKLYGYMVEFETWEHYIRISLGSSEMKDRVIKIVEKNFGRPELLDSLKLGLAFRELVDSPSEEEREDFLETIKLTRFTDLVPIVEVRNDKLDA